MMDSLIRRNSTQTSCKSTRMANHAANSSCPVAQNFVALALIKTDICAAKAENKYKVAISNLREFESHHLDK